MADFARRVNEWQRIMATVPLDFRVETYSRAAVDLAGLVAEGSDRPLAVDALAELAEAHNLPADWAQDTVAKALDEADKHRANGHDKRAAQLPKLSFVDLPALDGLPVPVREWAVLDRIPARNVTLLSGDGGVGKTLLVMQLAVATVLGRDWLGAMPLQGPVILVSAEDDEKEIHFRLARIAEHYGASFADLGDLHIVSLVGKDSAIGIADRGIVKPTLLFHAVCREIERIKPVWIGFDTAADMFIVEERDRVQARQAINMLRGMAWQFNTAALLLSHPSLSGLQSGSGMSGSTGWNNSVRSRLYLYTPKGDDDEITDKDARVLETMKANYAAGGDQLRLRWCNGLLVPEGGQMVPATSYDRATAEHQAQQVFKTLLRQHNADDMPVSPNSAAKNFAPTVFSRMPQTKPLHITQKTRKAMLQDAMHALLKAGEIKTGTGPKGVRPSKQTQCLYLKSDGEELAEQGTFRNI